MAASRNIAAILASFLLLTSTIATQLVERNSNEGYGMLITQDIEECPANTTIDCLITDVCCPTGSWCFGGAFQGICCPTNSDCTPAVTSKPSCANSSWTLYSTDSSPAEQVQDGYLFCCDEGSVGLNVGQCWASSDIVSGSVVGYATASAISQGNAAPTTHASTTAGSGKATTTTAGGAATATTKSLGIRNTGPQLFCFGTTAFVLLVGLL